MHNLMASTAIATVFLNRDLRVMRYTAPAVALFNLIPSDIGRPLEDLKRRINYPELSLDAERVLGQLVPVEREVSDLENRWFMARVLPYRSLDDRISGVVLTFIEITERKEAEEALRRSEARLSAIFTRAAVGLAELSPDGRFERVNAELCRVLERPPQQLLALNFSEVVHPDDLKSAMGTLRRVVESGEPVAIDERMVRADGGAVWINCTLCRLAEADGSPGPILAVVVDLSARRAA